MDLACTAGVRQVYIKCFVSSAKKIRQSVRFMAFPTSGDIFLLSLCFFLFWIITQFDFPLFMPVNIIDSSFGASVLGWEYNLP